MGRLGVRLAMAAVGLTLLAGYLAAAYLGYLGLYWLWANRPDLPTLVAIVVGVGIVSAYLSYRLGTSQLLAALETNRLPRSRAPGLHRRVDELAARMDVDRPDLFLTRAHAPNAVAIGGAERGALVLDRSLFRLLQPAELEAIIAHELAHLERNDGLLLAVVQGLSRTVVGLVTVALVPAILALSGLARGSAWLRGRPFDRSGPFARLRRLVLSAPMLLVVATTLLVRARSRRREFAADDRAASVTGNPEALARALKKIERAQEPAWPLAPLSSHRESESRIERWLSTHPSTDERIERLAEQAESRKQQRERRGEGNEGPTVIPIE
ncbi:M48 family metallopeptidase [Haloparvum sp. AD34]